MFISPDFPEILENLNSSQLKTNKMEQPEEGKSQQIYATCDKELLVGIDLL